MHSCHVALTHWGRIFLCLIHIWFSRTFFSKKKVTENVWSFKNLVKEFIDEKNQLLKNNILPQCDVTVLLMYFVKTQRIKCLRLFITYKFCMFLAENAQFNLSQTTISIFEFKKMSGFNEQIHKLQNLQITKKAICTHTFFLFDTLSRTNQKWQFSSISWTVEKKNNCQING